MDEVDRISKALTLVEKYESYLFRRAWGVTLIIFAIVIPLTALLNLLAPSIAPYIGMSAESFILLSSIITWIIGISLIFYSFASASKISSRQHQFSFRKEMPHIIAIMLIWIISFTLLNFAPEPVEVVANLWAAGIACILTYIVLKSVPTHANYPEIALVGFILLIASLIVLFITDMAIAELITIVVFALSFLVGGLYSILTASKVLTKIE
ncbi:MAG: hypothetical protein EU536_04255 [Promethearchaeota archaeon]|nr:MAG: hypothetical protein EU536_04255 [Candidatus Lokiarchaeota archaeon]